MALRRGGAFACAVIDSSAAAHFPSQPEKPASTLQTNSITTASGRQAARHVCRRAGRRNWHATRAKRAQTNSTALDKGLAMARTKTTALGLLW